MSRMLPDQLVRASDQDRDGVVWLLREQTSLGRLTLEEFQERMGAALTVRTWGELRALLSDLPVSFPFSDTAGTAEKIGQHRDTATSTRTRRIDWSDVGFWALFSSPLLVAGLAWILHAPVAVLLVLTVLALMSILMIAG